MSYSFVEVNNWSIFNSCGVTSWFHMDQNSSESFLWCCELLSTYTFTGIESHQGTLPWKISWLLLYFCLAREFSQGGLAWNWGRQMMVQSDSTCFKPRLRGSSLLSISSTSDCLIMLLLNLETFSHFRAFVPCSHLGGCILTLSLETINVSLV